MIQKLSDRITDFSIRQGVIDESERETFIYCFELLLNGGIATAIIICISLFTNRFIETLFWGLGFWPLRVFAGGYHAASHEKCLTITVLVYFLSLIALNLYKSHTFIAVILPVLISVIVVFFFAPLSNTNKPLTLEKYYILRKKSRMVVSINALVVSLDICLLPASSYLISLVCGQFIATTSIILEVIKNKQKRR